MYQDNDLTKKKNLTNAVPIKKRAVVRTAHSTNINITLINTNILSSKTLSSQILGLSRLDENHDNPLVVLLRHTSCKRIP